MMLSTEAMRALILHRDDDILVLNKPAGIPVHRGYGGGEALEDGFAALQFDADRTPGLGHRLDRDTSGCLVLGRHRKALQRLNQLFRHRRVEKTYWAIVHGAPPGMEGEVELPLRQQVQGSGWRMVPARSGEPDAQEARSEWRLMGRGEGVSWLEVKPHTGRTHQIRVHCAHLGCPLVGDHLYGGAVRDGPGLRLHARAIAFQYQLGQRIEVQAEPPEPMRQELAAMRPSGL